MSALYLAVFGLSAATLIFEIALTRVFSVAQWYHFAFMTVSLALLGFGASGTLLALSPRLLKRDLAKLLATLCLAFSISVVGSYLISDQVPFDSFQIAFDRRQIIYLAIYYLSLAVPFFFTGLGIGVLLAAMPDQAGKIYFANLIGSGLGCPLALAALSLLGGEVDHLRLPIGCAGCFGPRLSPLVGPLRPGPGAGRLAHRLPVSHSRHL